MTPEKTDLHRCYYPISFMLIRTCYRTALFSLLTFGKKGIDGNILNPAS